MSQITPATPVRLSIRDYLVVTGILLVHTVTFALYQERRFGMLESSRDRLGDRISVIEKGQQTTEGRLFDHEHRITKLER